MADRRGRLVVISGPSGVGKSTVVRRLRSQQPFAFSISATTRPRRPDEVDGVHYHFVDRDTFLRWRDEGVLLEWAEYGGNLYGTPRRDVDAARDAGEDVILDIENQGALQVKARDPDAILIFILPPDRETLEARLRGRGDTDEAAVRARLDVADAQIADARRTYDWLVTNDSVDEAVSQIRRILAVHERTL